MNLFTRIRLIRNLFYILLNLIPLLTFAQNKFQVGPIVGVGLTSMSDNYNQKNLHTGIITNFVLTPKLNLQPCLLASTKGYADTFIHPDKEVVLSYIDLITTLKYTPWKYFFMGAGLEAGYLTNANYRYLSYGTDYYDGFNLKPYANKIDLGINLKLGCLFDSGIGLEFSYLGGLMNVFDDDLKTFTNVHNNTITIPRKGRGKNTVISTSFYYLFGIRPNKKQASSIK